MNIKINLVEVASELAHNAMWDEVQYDLYSEDLYTKDENGNRVYHHIVQKVFDRWYDYFYDVINKYKINS